MRPIDADVLPLTDIVIDNGLIPDDDRILELPPTVRAVLLRDLNSAPTIDVQSVVHAYWKLDPNGMDFGLPAWKCSNCGMKNTMIPPFIHTKHGGYVPKNPNVFAGSNYCPNCGARMDEDNE